MPFLVSFLFGFFPMLFFAFVLYWFDRYEKEPKVFLVAVFLWGAVVAAGGGFFINTILGVGVYLFTGSETATELATGSLIAPFIEELLKGCAILIVFLVFRQEFDSILDGIIYGGITALGFAASENTYYIYTYGFLKSGWIGIWSMVFIRVFLVGWQHPFYTAFSGIGLAISRLNRQVWIKIIAPLAGFCLAVLTHSFHNILTSILSGYSGLAIGTFIDWIGWLCLFCYMLWVIHKERQNLKIYLLEDVNQGIISSTQYQIATSARAQSAARFSALFAGCFKNTHRFYSLCGELAHKKFQFSKLGNEDGNIEVIKDIQAELSLLSHMI
jgi:RsiW-degrading membrane proteinase PrsW (M82 family)